MKSYDPQGTVYVNRARFAFTDPTSGIRYEPGEEVRATPTDWLASQTYIHVVDVEAAPVDDDAAKKKAEEDAAAQKLAEEEAAAQKLADAQKAAVADEKKADTPAVKK